MAAAASTRAGHVGVIATAGTVASGAYAAAVGEADPKLAVTQLACPELVPMVEAGQLSGPIAEAAVRGYLGQLFAADAEIDTLLLGCTHYPLLRPLIEQVAGPRVAVVDSAFTTALAAEDLLDALGGRTPHDGAGREPDRDDRRRGDLHRGCRAPSSGRPCPRSSRRRSRPTRLRACHAAPAGSGWGSSWEACWRWAPRSSSAS